MRENSLMLEVSDNGKGFDTNNVQSYNGNRLKNTKACPHELKAILLFTSKINEGTKIELVLKSFQDHNCLVKVN